MKKVLFSLALYYCVILCSFTNAEVVISDGGAIHGQILDKITGEPIPFANVFIGATEQREIKANELGEFSFIDLQGGEYLLSASYNEYLTDFVTVKIGDNEILETNIGMEDHNYIFETDVVFN